MQPSSTSRRLSALYTATIVALSLLPLWGLIAFVNRFYVDIPVWDQWNGEGLLIVRSYEGTVTWSVLAEQHNEHRPLFARLVWIPLAHWTGWDTRYDVAVNIALAVATWLALLYGFSAALSGLGERRVNWLWPVLSVLCFSVNQWENWLHGLQVMMFLNIFAVVAGLVVLVRARWWSFGLALLLGVVATYSMANGLLYWPAGLCVLAPAVWRNKKRWLYLGLWIAFSALMYGLYFNGYRQPQVHPPLDALLKAPLEYAVYVLLYLGAPVLPDAHLLLVHPPLNEHPLALVPGLFGIAAVVWSTWRLYRRKRLLLFTPFVALALYAIWSAMIIGIGRLGYGWEQALSPRYVTTSSLLWIAVVVLLCATTQTREFAGQPGRRAAARRVAGFAAIVMVVVLSLWSSINWVRPAVTTKHAMLVEARQAIVSGVYDDAILTRIFPDPKFVREQLDKLKRYRLWIYRDEESRR